MRRLFLPDEKISKDFACIRLRRIISSYHPSKNARSNNERKNIMPEAEKQRAPEKPPGKITIEIASMDTTGGHIKSAYLDVMAKKYNKSFHAGEVLKLAFIAFAADCAALPKGSPERAKFAAQLDATPGWFGSGNNSACRQYYDKKGGIDEVMKDYSNV